ncbi:Glycine--tRNA ligase protein [Dioscorea alata]|uniref:Glycine--tRNA ligase protein n=1 Tax=Dioscorea alata TaxID=55571 RepID=A0ACB7UCN9_DIOAL|nr:Glycine--tRNA ligase protein [Dioscorea alata]
MEERKENIVRDSTSLTEGVGGCRVMDDNLLNEVANLVKAPVLVLGKFDEAFLELPKDILIMASMVSALVSIEEVQLFGFYPTASIGGAEGSNQIFFDPYVSAGYSAAPGVPFLIFAHAFVGVERSSFQQDTGDFVLFAIFFSYIVEF